MYTYTLVSSGSIPYNHFCLPGSLKLSWVFCQKKREKLYHKRSLENCIYVHVHCILYTYNVHCKYCTVKVQIIINFACQAHLNCLGLFSKKTLPSNILNLQQTSIKLFFSKTSHFLQKFLHIKDPKLRQSSVKDIIFCAFWLIHANWNFFDVLDILYFCPKNTVCTFEIILWCT